MHRDAAADQRRGDVGLEVRERQHQVGREREDLVDVGRDEGGDARLLAPHARRPHRIAGHADDARLLAEQVERLDGLLGQADDALRREHARLMASDAIRSPLRRAAPGRRCATRGRPRSAPPGWRSRRTSPAMMADIDHRHLGLVAQPHQVGQDLALARRIERGERLVEQQEARPHQQRAADGDALALAARELAGPAIEQVADVEQLDDARPSRRRRAQGRSCGGRSRDCGAP